MLLRSGLWLLMVASVAAYDYYYDGRNQLDYNDALLELPYDVDFELPNKISLNDLASYKIMKTLQNSNIYEPSLRFGDSSKINTEGNRWLSWLRPSSEVDFKADVVKKEVPKVKSAGDLNKVKPAPRQPSKWRIKRPPQLCLLKLCAPYKYIIKKNCIGPGC